MIEGELKVKIVISCVLVLLIAGCGRSKNSLSFGEATFVGIIGGTDASPTDPVSRSTVMIYSSKFYCSGTVIAPRFVLTAAHCVTATLQPSRIEFSNGTNVPVLRWFIHPDANQQQAPWHDLALLELQRGVPVSAVAKLAGAHDLPSIGDWSEVAGFGYSDLTTKATGKLKSASVQIIDVAPNSAETLTKGFGSGSCGGDSGGPAYQVRGNQVVIWGVTSRPSLDGEAQCGDLEFYSNVTAASEWIQSITK